MWVPGALVIWIAITIVYFRWTHSEDQAEGKRMEARLSPSRAGMVLAPPPFPER